MYSNIIYNFLSEIVYHKSKMCAIVVHKGGIRQMIKLIATDMDGTFLDNKKQFDKSFSDLFF